MHCGSIEPHSIQGIVFLLLNEATRWKILTTYFLLIKILQFVSLSLFFSNKEKFCNSELACEEAFVVASSVSACAPNFYVLMHDDYSVILNEHVYALYGFMFSVWRFLYFRTLCLLYYIFVNRI